MVRRAAGVFALLVLAWIAAGVGVWLAAPAPPGGGEKFDAIIVLGAGCDAEGRPTPALEGRVRKGVALFDAGRAPVLILTGKGRGAVAESECARTLALELGVPRQAILTEARSMTTRGNALESRELIKGGRVLLVSSPYHGYRAVRLFKPLFGEVAFEASSEAAWGMIAGMMREPAGVLKMFWVGLPAEDKK